MSDQELSQAYQQATHTADRSACPSAEQLAALAAGELDTNTRPQLADHVAACRACANELILLGEAIPELQTLSQRALQHGKEQQQSLYRWRWLRVLAPAALALAVGLLWLGNLSDQLPQQPRMRSDNAAVLPANRASLRASPADFEWQSVGTGAHYQLEVLHSDATRAWISDWQDSNSIKVSPELDRLFAAGETWIWQVRVSGAPGTSVLGPYWFQIEPEQ